MLICRMSHFVAAVLLLFGLVNPLAAFYFQKSDEIYLSGEFDEDVLLAGGTVNFDGAILGDLNAASRIVTFDGMVDGNLNAAAQKITVNGEICRSLRAFAQTVSINSRIDGDVVAFASDITFSEDASVGRDIALFGTEAFVSGAVGADAYVNGNIVTISGRIEGDLKVSAAKISIAPGAYVGGDFSYESKEKAKISPDAQILGETRWKKRTGGESGMGYMVPPPSGPIWSLLFLLASVVIGITVIAVNRNFVNSVAGEIRHNGAVAGLLGLAIVIVLPVAILLSGITIAGLPIAFAGLSLYAIFFLLGKIFVAITIGMILMGLIRKGKNVSLGWSLIIGLVLVALMFKIPVVGWIIYLVAWIVGTGAMVISACRRKPATTVAVAETTTTQ
ncbi:MAG: polymer-forming cytoskeletal protein [Candidatus Zixiibacteriota bacterium]